ncbi:MAG TPA: DNA mismatch repair protein MutS [Dehalococcoidia bacterium]|nr:DNA mismatch repair protein MutS [Dehalococcoidia bacterium]
MNFESILFETDEDRPVTKPELPDFFIDLNLDQIVEAVVKDKEEYDLKSFFWHPLKRISAIEYRHDVMRELEKQELTLVVEAFAKRMRTMRDYIMRSNRLSYYLQKQRWFLDAVDVYCEAVGSLYSDLSAAELKSQGFLAFREYLKDYAYSETFNSLKDKTQRLRDDIAAVDYCIHIKGKYFTVRRRESEIDYGADVEETFARFNQGNVKDYLTTFSEPIEMNGIEESILSAVARLYPEVFNSLDEYCEQHIGFLDETIATFDREVQFYISYLTLINSVKSSELTFCYPEVVDTSKEISQSECFDLALAIKLMSEQRPVVCNDYYLEGKERIFVVSGPNQGGKTTFARSFGQSHYLASLGCPVPGKEAKLFLFDRLFTHFEQEENVEDLRSKLEDDLTRIHGILDEATSRSIIIANEVLTSTTLNDAIFLGEKVMESLSRIDLICIWVTFIEELVSYSDKAVSMVSIVDPEDPSIRTYKVRRRSPLGLSYATALAEKYGLTYDSLRERIK